MKDSIKTKVQKYLVLLIAVAGMTSVYAQDANGIIKKARDRIDADTVSSRSQMILESKGKVTSERLLDQYSSDTSDGTRTIIVFQKPATVAGTRFLTMEKKNSDDDRWIFLPSLGKVRRIAASEGSGSFMGTDLSYDDISSTDRDVSLDTHTLLREETLSGKACHVIESIPVDKDYQYSKMISWIDKENFVAWKIELYGKNGELLKILEVLETAVVQSRITPMRTRMTTVADETSTTINVKIMKYDDPIPEGVFTVDFLATGRVR